MRFNFTATYLIFLLAITASITVLATPILKDSTNDLVSEDKRSPGDDYDHYKDHDDHYYDDYHYKRSPGDDYHHGDYHHDYKHHGDYHHDYKHHGKYHHKRSPGGGDHYDDHHGYKHSGW
ncbi:hypothetical protein C2G38_2062428 [Gigaspora rosea]|uniref:Uncharacterized protein n=1 Tax=Gigaspora rosea TaxID=44941 RepID=A0A397VZQ8_9GLOM|nr:hypothetical protein C2G38_2062428 [Gigaspora rosea]